jgi:hypothetical protein
MLNPFDLNLARAYSSAKAFCPRPDVAGLLQRAHAGKLWTLITGDRRLGKSTSVITACVEAGWPILHVDLMGVTVAEEVAERFRWSWQLFQQQEARGFLAGVTGEISAKIPGTGIDVKLASGPGREPKTWGEVIARFDQQTARCGGVLFVDELQDVLNLPHSGAFARSFRAALQMARNITPVLAGSSQHLLAPMFDTAAAPFFKSVRLNHRFLPIDQAAFVDWMGRLFKTQGREVEVAATQRLFELTEGVTEDLVATCAEVWLQVSPGRAVTPSDVEGAWRLVVNNAFHLFSPLISKLSPAQAHLLRYIARNPRCEPFSELSVRELASTKSSIQKALTKLLALELVRLDGMDRSRRVRVNDPRVAYYLKA